MRSRSSFKKAAALVLSGALTLGAVPLSPLVQEAHADTAAAQPSVVAYATADDLQDIPLVEGETGYTGDVTKVGRIRFGKDKKGKVMEWYVLGSDPGVTGDNIAVFAASDMIPSAMFNPNYALKDYGGNTDGIYETTTGEDRTGDKANIPDKKVWSNHYGASLIRENLQSYAEDYTYFTSAEQELMQATTVDTPDYKKNSDTDSFVYATNPKVYTTSDKLYLAWGDPRCEMSLPAGDEYAIGKKADTIYVGGGSGRSKNGIPVTLGDNFLGATERFWLRPAYASTNDYALVANDSVKYSYVHANFPVRPASNLKLSSVIFASAASAASSTAGAAGTIRTSAADKDAMMLRLDPALKADGTERAEADKVKIGGVSADAANGTITATKDAAAPGDVTLIVQGRNAGTDWYYTKTVTSTTGETVTLKDDIVPELTDAGVTLDGTTAEEKAVNIDLTKCKIWVETPAEPSVAAADRTIFYAVDTKATTHTHTYPATGDEDYWNGHDGEYHWQECTDDECPDKAGSITNKVAHSETNPYGKDDADDDHHWKVCPDCGEIIKDTVKEHSPSNWTPSDGESHTGTCKDCSYEVTGDHSFVHSSDKRYHWNECEDCEYEEPDSRQEHTFGEDGRCSDDDCNYDLNTGHDIREVDEAEPGCDKVGYVDHLECRLDGHETEIFIKNELGLKVFTDRDSITIEAKGHTAGDTYAKIDETYDAPVCKDCGETITDKKEKHDFDENGVCKKGGCSYDVIDSHDIRWVDQVDPKCDEAGYEGHWVCSLDGHEAEIIIENEQGQKVFTDLKSITIPAKGHTEGDTYVKIDDTYDAPACEDCGKPITDKKEKHEFDVNGICQHGDCSYDLTEGHNIHWVAQEDPECDEAGYKGHWECDKTGHSGEIFIENELGLKVFTDRDSITIEAKGHTAGDTYAKIDETYDAPVCKDCGETITDKKEKHDFDENGVCKKGGCSYDKNASDHTHTYDETIWKSDVAHHWHACTICGEKIDGSIESHVFSSGKCNICGRTRVYDDSSDDDDSSSYTSNASTAGSVAADADGSWSQDERGMRFEYADGSYAKGRLETNQDGTTTMYVAWIRTGGKRYAFDADGYAMQDWLYDASDDSWYYCDEDNGSQSGWLYTPVDNCWYYLDPNSGAMLTGWVTIDDKRYYFSEAHNGTYYQDSVTHKWIYANPNQYRPLGSMYVNTVTPDGILVGADGAYIPQ